MIPPTNRVSSSHANFQDQQQVDVQTVFVRVPLSSSVTSGAALNLPSTDSFADRVLPRPKPTLSMFAKSNTIRSSSIGSAVNIEIGITRGGNDGNIHASHAATTSNNDIKITLTIKPNVIDLTELSSQPHSLTSTATQNPITSISRSHNNNSSSGTKRRDVVVLSDSDDEEMQHKRSKIG
jgi:hypothetical protein